MNETFEEIIAQRSSLHIEFRENIRSLVYVSFVSFTINNVQSIYNETVKHWYSTSLYHSCCKFIDFVDFKFYISRNQNTNVNLLHIVIVCTLKDLI